MNKEMNSNKKNIIFTMILLTMLIPVVVGYTLAILNFLSRDIKEKDIDIVNQVEELDLQSTLVTKLYQQTIINNDNQEKKLILNNLDYNDMNLLPDELKLTFAYNNLKEEDITISEELKTVSLIALEESYQDFFNLNTTFEKVDFTPVNCNEKFTYNIETEQYTSSFIECTDEKTIVEGNLIRAEKEGKNVIIEEKFYFLNDGKYYQDKELTTLISDVEITNIDEYYDKMSSAIYTFTLDNNDKYHLSQFKINK